MISMLMPLLIAAILEISEASRFNPTVFPRRAAPNPVGASHRVAPHAGNPPYRPVVHVAKRLPRLTVQMRTGADDDSRGLSMTRRLEQKRQANRSIAKPLSLPSGPGAMVQQAAAAVRRASESGLNHQAVSLPLSEAIYGDREEGFVADRAIGWQGGPRETYRFLQPLAIDLLKQIDRQSVGLPPRVSEQPLLDFDGSSLLTSESASGPIDDVQAILQPNTDRYYLDVIEKVEAQFSDTPGKARRLLLLVNTAWRDRSSWGFFDGARAQRQVLDRYETTYALEQFVLRGEKLSLLRAHPYPWHVFLTVLGEEATLEESRRMDARIDGGGQARLLGTFENRPEYKQLDELVRLRQNDELTLNGVRRQ